jgi:thiamine pyrophosphate-dependent acetolactate synthase large subunit-like protein
MKVYEVVAKAIADEGVRALFTLVGNANMEMLASVRSAGSVPVYQTRIEGTAVGMAEGYARSSGRVGVAVVTSGPALANAVNALTSAARANTPLVLITGHPSSRDNHQHLHQEAVAELAGAAYLDVPDPTAVLDVVRLAFYTARTERRPVVLDIGRAVSTKEYDWPYDYEPSTEAIQIDYGMPPAQPALDAALEIIAASERPVIIAGAGAYAAGCRADVLALGEEIGALLATSLHVKNWFTGEPYNVGVAGLFSWHYAVELLAGADCVIGVGASLNYYTTEGGYLFPSAKVVQIDTKAELVLGTGRRADAYVRADASTAVPALLAAVRAKGAGGTRSRTPEIRQQIADGAQDTDPATFDIEPDRVDPRRILAVVDAKMPDPAGVTISTGHSWGLSNLVLKRWREPQLYSHAFGSIGIAFPLCLGAAVAHPDRPFLHVEGDGSIMMTVHGFDTLAHYDLPVFVVVLNDSAYSAEAHQLIAKGIDPEVAYLRDVDFAAVARSFGCRSAVIRSEEDMAGAVERFKTAPGPFVADVRVSRNVISAPFRRLHYGVSA